MSEHASMVARPEATWSSPPTDALVCAPYPEASSPLYLTPPALVTLPEPQESVDPGLSEPLTSGGDAGSEPEGGVEPEVAPDGEAESEAEAEPEADEEAVDEAAAETESETGAPEGESSESEGEEGAAGGGETSEGDSDAASEAGGETVGVDGTVATVGGSGGPGTPTASAGGGRGPTRASMVTARIGGTSPPRVGEPPPLPERAQREVKRRSGISADEHHDRIRAAVGRIAQQAHRAQVDIIHLVEGLASDLGEDIRADADAIPGFVAGLIARIEARVGVARLAVEEAHTAARAAITALVDETQAGLDASLEINRENVLTLMGEASQSVKDLYETTLSGEYQALASTWSTAIELVPVNLIPTLPDAATTAAGAFNSGTASNDNGEPNLKLFREEQKALAIVPHAADVLDGLNTQAIARGDVLTSSEAEGSFAMGVLAAVDQSAVIFDSSENAAEGVCEVEAQAQPPRLATPRERALRRVDMAKDDAFEGFDSLLRSARTSLTRAGRQARDSFRQQAVDADASVRTLAPEMAGAWRTQVRQMDAMVPPGELLDWTRLGPVLQRHEAGVGVLRRGQAQAVRDQARETRKGVDEALVSLRRDLEESANTIADGVREAKDRGIRRIRLAYEALAPFQSFGAECFSNAETWATDTDEGLDTEVIARITTQARRQLSGSETSLETTFFKRQYDDFVKVCEDKRDAFSPTAASPDALYLRVDDNVERLVETKAQAVRRAGVKDDGIIFTATDEDLMLQSLMGLTSKGMDAVRERFSGLGLGDLDAYVLGELDDDSTEKRAGQRLLDGDTEGALQDIIAAGLSWATTEEALLSLSAADVEAIRNDAGWEETRVLLDRQVHGTNNSIAHALLEGDRTQAAALKLGG